MKKNMTFIVCLITALFFIYFPITGCAQAEREGVIHRFLDLSFTTATPDNVEQALLDHYGIGWDPAYEHYLLGGITEFDHEFSFHVDFNAKQDGMIRIILRPAGRNIWSGDTEEFTTMLWHDFADCIVLESQITARYGQPDLRYFFVDGANYNAVGIIKAMFTSGQWDAEQMMELCRIEKGTKAYTIWGNVVLEHWVSWRDPGPKKSKSSLTLYYHDALWATDITPDSIVVYPPDSGV